MSESAVTPERHARAGFSMRAVSLAMAALFALVLAGLGVTALMLYVFMGGIALSPPSVPPFPHPALQLSPTSDLAHLKRREQARLNERAAMPIERAMGTIERRGKSAFEPLVPPQPGADSWPPQAGSQAGTGTGGRR